MLHIPITKQHVVMENPSLLPSVVKLWKNGRGNNPNALGSGKVSNDASSHAGLKKEFKTGILRREDGGKWSTTHSLFNLSNPLCSQFLQPSQSDCNLSMVG
ncbi:hypothetical protein MRB53_005823 [Persea americana]|uniref:Uncharacterized protein n=1 Tax=Persea americana TaxID=3435 RepID=A0ACC2MF58_PERAE|nr:hypothetical protein MRB53_005823 [Persea americana]